MAFVIITALAFQFPVYSFAQTTPESSSLGEVEGASTSAELQGLEELSGESLDDLNIPEILSETANPSAQIQTPPIVRGLSKSDFRVNENIEFKIDNGKGVKINIKVISQSGGEISVEIQERIQNNAKFLTIIPPQQLRPGKYTLEVTDSTGGTFEQDFTWGVLAINPNKSIYLSSRALAKEGLPNEMAKLSFAVLDETGLMVCNASLKLKIKNAKLKIDDELSTDNGLIKVNDVCNEKKFTLIPDYEANYTVGEAGVYELNLTAKTDNGTYTISDSFEVRNSVPFDVERITATRIFPPEIYPVTLKIKANKDFSGIITETVPASFVIPDLPPNATVSTITEKEAISEDVLGASVDLIMPFDTTLDGTASALTSGFGEKLDDQILQEKYDKYGVAGHDGADFEMPIGTKVVAVDDGRIVLAKENSDYGTTVVIEHSWGKTYYGHLSEIKVKKGQKVSKGRLIALSGNTGLSTAPHLHFGIKPEINDVDNGFYGKVDPLPYLGIKARGEVLGASTDENKVKVIAWRVELSKGEEIELSYTYKAPEISPQFYTIGPLRFLEDGGKIVFSEKRRWQIAVDATKTIEQQINIIDQEYTTSSTSYVPTDNSLGIIQFDPSKYNGETMYLEAILKTESGGSYARYRSSSISLPSSAKEYTVRLTRSTTSGCTGGQYETKVQLYSITDSAEVATVENNNCTTSGGPNGDSADMIAARLIVVQSDGTNITDTQTQVEVGNNDTTTGTTYADLTDMKIYRYTSGSWTPSPTIYFEASLNSTVGTATTTYSFNAYDSGTAWTTNPSQMVDGSTSNFAVTGGSDETQRNNANTCDATCGAKTETITKVEVRVYACQDNKDNGQITLTPQFNNATSAGDGHIYTPPNGNSCETEMAAWSSYFDITSDTNAPTWDWGEIENLDIDVFGDRRGGPDIIHAAQVEIQVTYESGAGTSYAALYTTGGSLVTSSEVSVNTSSWDRQRSSAITLVDGTDYVVRTKTSDAGATAYIANAKIILEQTAGGGIDALETVHQYVNTLATDTDSTYTLQNFDNQFNPSNWTDGTFNYYFESTMKTSAGTGYSQLYNVSDSDAIDTSTNSEITTTNTSYERQISADLSGNSDWPSAAKTMDAQIKNSATNTTSISSSWLRINVSGLTAGGEAETPTNAQLMRHGRWFNASGAIQPFTF